MPTYAAPLTATIRGSHMACTRLVALDLATGSIVRTWENGAAVLLDGTVTFDLGQMVRRSGQVTMLNADGALSPQAAGELFYPGSVFRVERGALMASGLREYLSLATFVVTRPVSTMGGRLAIAGEDLFTLLRQPMGDVVSVDDGMTAEDALRSLWADFLPSWVLWLLDGAGRTVKARSWTADDERLAAGVGLMADLGLEAFSDREGNVVLRPIPDPTAVATTRVFPIGTVLELSRSIDRRPYNRVVVIVERPDGTLLRAVAEVTDPASPIHSDRIGIQTAPIYRSAQIPDQAAANAVAQALLVSYSLVADSADVTAVPDETLSEGDVIELTEPLSGTSGRYRIERLSIPVLEGTMSIGAAKVIPLFASVT